MPFKGDSFLALRTIKNVLTSLNNDPMMNSRILNIQKRLVESPVKRRLLNNRHFNADKTQSKRTGAIAAIMSNINSGVTVKNSVLTVWTGKIDLMDTQDPIHTAKPQRTLGHNLVRLWRILEAGTKARDYPISSRSGKELRFYWPAKGKVTKVSVQDQPVIHPGILRGRSYFFQKNSFLENQQIRYESQTNMFKLISSELKKFMVRKSRK